MLLLPPALISCVEINSCPLIYGTETHHFLAYGYISPVEYQCLIQVE
jgi:hypothetical protein